MDYEVTAAEVVAAAEAATIERLHAFVDEPWYELRGRHHEIYLGDPRCTAPERLKTVICHPVRLRRQGEGQTISRAQAWTDRLSGGTASASRRQPMPPVRALSRT